MRLIYISNSIIPSRTANSIHVMKMCQALANTGFEVVLLAPNIKKQYEKNVKNIYEFYGVKNNFLIKKLWHPNFKIGAVIYAISIFFYILMNNEFKLIYGRFLLGCYIATFLKKKVFFETHTPIYEVKNFNYLIFKKIIISKYFKKLIVISNSLKRMYLENGYLNNSKIQVAHDGADEVVNYKIKRNLFGNKNSLKVGYVGHLYKGRGIDLIIECAKFLNDVTFHVVGGMEKDISYWKNHLNNLNLSNIFFYGFVSPLTSIEFKNSFDVFLAPYGTKVSVFGNTGDTSKFMSPLKIFEYMAHKKPIIASNLPALREVLNSKNSILVNSENIKDWVNAINVLREEKKREELASNAYRDFKKYSWKNRVFEIFKDYL